MMNSSVKWFWGSLMISVTMIILVLNLDNTIALFDEYDALNRRQSLLDRLSMLPERERAIRQRLEDLGESPPELFLYPSNQNVFTLVQRDLRELASETDVRLSSIRRSRNTQSSKPSSQLVAVSVSIALTTDQENLASFLSGLENRKPMLIPSNMSIIVAQPSTETTPASLRVTMDMSGYQLKGDSRP